jgi:hypothetical protein
MKLILITSNGAGAGKTTFAAKLGGRVVRLGQGLRQVAASHCISQQHAGWVIDSYTQEAKQKLVAVRTYGDESGVMSVRNLLIMTAQDLGDEEMVKLWATNLLRTFAYEKPLAEIDNLVVVDDVRSVNQLLMLKEKARIFNATPTHLHLEARGVSVLPDLNYERQVIQLKNMCDYLIVRDDRPISVEGNTDTYTSKLRWGGI